MFVFPMIRTNRVATAGRSFAKLQIDWLSPRLLSRGGRRHIPPVIDVPKVFLGDDWETIVSVVWISEFGNL